MLSPLSAIDATVKAHEWSHLLTLGPYAAGPIQYDFVIDAEGNRYAVGGSIAVDLSPVPGDPEATARKARAVLQAAYAPGNPSGADMQVAQKAYMLLRQAEEELKTRAEAHLDPVRPSGDHPLKHIERWAELQPGHQPEHRVKRQPGDNPLHQPERQGGLWPDRQPGNKTIIGHAYPSGPSADAQAGILNPLEGAQSSSIESSSERIQGSSPLRQGSSIQTSLYEKNNQPGWILGYSPTGERGNWYEFWFEREESDKRGALFSIWV